MQLYVSGACRFLENDVNVGKHTGDRLTHSITSRAQSRHTWNAKGLSQKADIKQNRSKCVQTFASQREWVYVCASNHMSNHLTNVTPFAFSSCWPRTT